MTTDKMYIIANGAEWNYAWLKDITELSADLDEEAMETIADMEIGQCFHTLDTIIVRVLG